MLSERLDKLSGPDLTLQRENRVTIRQIGGGPFARTCGQPASAMMAESRIQDNSANDVVKQRGLVAR